MRFLLRSSAIFKFEIDHKYCFLWSNLASLHPFNNSNPDKVTNYRQTFNDLNIEGFDYTNEFKCTDAYTIAKINIVSINILELGFYQDHND